MTKAQTNLLNLCDIPAEEIGNPIALIKRIGAIESLLRTSMTAKKRRAPTKRKETVKAKKSPSKLIARIRSTRERYGLSREAFAAFVGCHVQTLYSWETGRGTPSDSSQELIRQAIRAVEKNRLTVAEQNKKVTASPASAS